MPTNVTEVVNALWPIVGISAGFALGFSILSMVAGAIKDSIDRDSFPPSFDPIPHQGPSLTGANAIEYLAEVRPPAIFASRVLEQAASKECRYCGTEYEGKTCPQCGGPRK